MDLRQLRQFVVLAETLSFRRAAERLHMAQPPLSVAIRKLEDGIGTPLFTRLPRGVQLTVAGHAALGAARRCLSQAERIPALARAAAQGESGELRIGFVGSATYALMPRLLPAFRRRYPQVTLVLRESNNLDLLAMVEADQIDVGLVRHPVGSASALRFEVVEHDVFCAVLPIAHPLAKKRCVTLQALAAEPLIDYASTRVPGLHAMAMLAFHQAGLAPRVVQEATQVQTVVSLVQSGLGVALVPSVTRHLALKGVVFKPVADLPASAAIAIAMASRPDGDSATARRFRELALVAGERSAAFKAAAKSPPPRRAGRAASSPA